MIGSIKVVKVDEMRRIEAAALEVGYSALDFMNKAAAGMAEVIERFILERQLPKKVVLLAGRGNNAGDAYTVGVILLSKHFLVRAVTPYVLDECLPLCLEKARHFIEWGGTITPILNSYVDEEEVLLDGLVGTGFRGKAEGRLAEAIEWGTRSGLTTFSIDIPSGLNGTTGTVGSIAIRASATLYLGLPKIGFFLGEGWEYIGRLIPIDFGLPHMFIEQAKPEALLLDSARLTLPCIRRSRHKYQAGYVLGIAGSKWMSGSAELAAEASLRSGAGIVRLFSDPSPSAIREVIHSKRELAFIRSEEKRASAYFIGPGLGREDEIATFLRELLPIALLPCVVDADALHFLAKNPSCPLPKQSILTPHAGEMREILQSTPSIEACQGFVENRKTILILKGTPTVVFCPQKKPLMVVQGDPGMATAGSGDVLTGILAGLLAQGVPLYQAAVLGSYLHGYAGQCAAEALSSYCMVASDIIRYLPMAFKSLIK